MRQDCGSRQQDRWWEDSGSLSLSEVEGAAWLWCWEEGTLGRLLQLSKQESTVAQTCLQ